MVLLLAVAAGLIAGSARAWYRQRRLHPPHLRLIWLVPVAFFPHWLAFYLPVTRRLIPDNLAAVALVSAQALLLVFAWFNRKQAGFWALGVGLALNLLVIALNGGLMPVSPEIIAQILPETPPGTWKVGDHLGWSIVLPVANTRLWWLSDQILLPAWFPIRKALSAGDVLIASGAFWLLWTLGSPEPIAEKKGD